MYQLWPEEEFFKIMAAPLESARNCVGCGQCEAKCPYVLPIREMIQDSLTYYRQLLEARKRARVKYLLGNGLLVVQFIT
jgi:predicted aldo/keto reductase-like oxidoreductase